jgi:transcriptional regulator with XRE-family HTH domain
MKRYTPAQAAIAERYDRIAARILAEYGAERAGGAGLAEPTAPREEHPSKRRPRATTTADKRERPMKRLRLQANMTQRQVADGAGLCLTTLRNIEAGRFSPWPEDLALIAAAIGAGLGRPVSVNELVGLPVKAPAATGEETPPSTRSRTQRVQPGRTR